MAQQTVLYVNALPGPVRSFTAKTAAPAGTFTEDAVKRSIFVHFAANYGGSGTQVVDLEPVDSEDGSFVEIEVETFNPIRFREGGQRRIGVEVTAYCWQKSSSNAYAVHELADEVASALRHQYLDVDDHDNNGDLVGGCVLYEPRIDDATEDIADDFRSDWRLAVVTCMGEAQET